ncbi:S8 family peptidase [Streptomyces bauhiniae]|uniref:S8 family peptidase n=1 Tax=Streptomyces bauhiniae TaxID=2340725 RepID=UPI0035DE5F1E
MAAPPHEGAATPPSAATADVASVPPGSHSVTLINGDKVTVVQGPGSRGGTVDARRPDGSPAPVHVIESGDDLYVYPLSTLPYVASSALDKRLFNVTRLIADGYDDAHTDRLPLLVSYRARSAAQRGTPAPPAGAVKVRALSSVHGAAISEKHAEAGNFWKAISSDSDAAGARSLTGGAGVLGAGLSKIWLDGRVTADLAESTAQIGAPTAWASGDTGQGVKVAVLDTGIDAGHPDLAGRIADSVSFVPGEDTADHVGHGTHVASTIAGTGAASDGKEQGVAPGAQLDIGKVLGNDGSGDESWVLAGMEWAARDKHAKIISLSLGSGPSDGSDPLSQAVDTLSAETGALFVVAAGNLGDSYDITSPGTAGSALTVGAVDSSDTLASFSSQGPEIGEKVLKPDLTAPGVDILAARSQYSADGEGYYRTMSGTSMATPHVAGTAALLAHKHPDWSGSQLKDALVSTTARTPRYTVYQAGNGRLDAAAAASATVFASASAYVAVPKSQAAPGMVSRPVAYTNTGASPIALSLAVDAPGAPAGLFSLSQQQVTVPPHGTATVNVSIDTAHAADGSGNTGQLLALNAQKSVVAHTALAMGTITPYHTLTLELRDQQGSPMGGTVELGQRGSDGVQFVDVPADTGRAKVLLAENVYSAMLFTNVTGAHGPNSLGLALLGNPDIDLTKDTSVIFDASKVTRVEAVTPRPASDTYRRLEYFRSMDGSSRSFIEGGVFYDSIWAAPTADKVKHGDFYFGARWRKEQPVLSVSTAGTDFDDVVQQQDTTPLTAGRHTFTAVFAGQGAAADYHDVNAHGKVAVVRRNSDVGDADQAEAAVAAGAKMLLVVSDYPYREIRSYGKLFQSTSIEVAEISKDEGEKLIAQVRGRKPVTVTAVSRPTSDLVYDLLENKHNSIPKNLIQHMDSGDLARVDERFDLPAGREEGGEFRYDWPSYSDWSIGAMSSRALGRRRTDWVSTGVPSRWGHKAYLQSLVFEVGPRETYTAGHRSSEVWFTPIERPFLNNNFAAPYRTGDTLQMEIPGWGEADRVGTAQGMANEDLALYQGSNLLGKGSATQVTGTAPAAGPLPYRVVVDGRQDPDASPYSTTTHTEWNFRSQAPQGTDKAVLPLLQLVYAISTDSTGKASRHTELTLTPQQLDGAVGAGTVRQVTLDVSYDDGAHWQPQILWHRGGDWTAQLRAPSRARYATIRASARDSAGNSVAQTVTRAFGLR